MSDDKTDAETEEASGEKPRKSKKRLLALILAPMLLGGIGFVATFSGALDFTPKTAKENPVPKAETDDIAYLSLEDILIPLTPEASARLLVFGASIEVGAGDLEALGKLRPRILDVLNTYLRVVDHKELEEPSAMPLLRARLLRRIRVVASPLEPRDLLITTFILK